MRLCLCYRWAAKHRNQRPPKTQLFFYLRGRTESNFNVGKHFLREKGCKAQAWGARQASFSRGSAGWRKTNIQLLEKNEELEEKIRILQAVINTRTDERDACKKELGEKSEVRAKSVTYMLIEPCSNLNQKSGHWWNNSKYILNKLIVSSIFDLGQNVVC